MKHLFAIASTITLAILVACSGNSDPSPTVTVVSASPQKFLGLLEIRIEGQSNGLNATSSGTASARFINPNSLKGGLKAQSATVYDLNGTSAINDVQFTTRQVSFLDDDSTNERYVFSSFDLINRTTTNFNNLTLYAVNKNGVTLGGSGIAAMNDATGASITSTSVARGFKPIHGIRRGLNELVVNADTADLQLFTPTEVEDSNPLTPDVKQQAVAQGILTSLDSVLEYGFVARNTTGSRVIAPRDSNVSTFCTVVACKGQVTFAYKIPVPSTSVQNRKFRPFAFSLYFVVANETDSLVSQSLEEQTQNTVAGVSSGFPSFSQVRTLSGAGYGMIDDNLKPLCQVKTAVGPDAFMGPVRNTPPPLQGLPDWCFGANGRRGTSLSTVSDVASGVAIQSSDNKIVVTGTSNDNFAVVRYNPDGTLDTTFDGDGKVTTDIGSLTQDVAKDVAIQADGKIVVVGDTVNTAALSDKKFALVRYNTNGSLDSSFDGDGKVVTQIGSSVSGTLTAVKVQSDGKIVVAGYYLYNYTSNYKWIAARYNVNGSLDTSFDTTGYSTLGVGDGDDFLYDLSIQTDGKIILAGSGSISATTNTSRIVVLRLNTNGSNDPGFSAFTAIGSSSRANAVTTQSDGKVVVAGYTSNGGTSDFALVRYNTNGTLDSSFDGDGQVVTSFGSGGSSYANDISIQADGKIIAAGVAPTNSSGGTSIALVRYETDGSRDILFGSLGRKTDRFFASGGVSQAMVLQPDGKIVVAGYGSISSSNDFAVARYNP
jgi:uncharacterized delta-60 repeat protein